MTKENDVNVTLGVRGEDSTEYFPCPVCFETLEVRYTKNSKPYCVCNDCGVQMFVRYKKGIQKFKNLISDCNYKVKSQKLIELIDYYDRLNEQLAEVVANKPFFGEDKDLNIQEKVIKKQLNSLKKQFKKI